MTRTKRQKALAQARKASVAVAPKQVAVVAKKNNKQKRKMIQALAPLNQPISRDLPIPVKDMEVFNNAIKLTGNHMMFEYLRTLIDPSGPPARYPDSNPRSTSLAQSVQIIDVPIQLDTTSTSGKFAALFQPHYGALDDPSHYACAVVAPGKFINPDWTNSSSYISNLNGSDLRLDPNYGALLMPNQGYSFYQGNTNMNAGRPFGDTPVLQNGYGLNGQYSASNHGKWYFPPGQYSLTAVAIGTTFASSFTASSTNCTFVALSSISDATSCTAEWVLSVNSKGAFFELDGPAGATTVTGSNLFITTTFTDESTLLPLADYGAIESYRPVSMSVLCTFTGPALVNGGNISAALVTGGTANTDFFSNQANSSTGQLQHWDNLGRVTESVSHELKHGTYTYWKYEDEVDAQIIPPSQVLQNQYPTIIVSGVYNPQQAPTGVTTVTGVIRMKVVRNIEFTTLQALYPKARCIGSQEMIDGVNAVLGDLPSSMMNASHPSFIKKIESGIKKGVGWAWKNRGTLGDIAKMIATVV